MNPRSTDLECKTKHSSVNIILTTLALHSIMSTCLAAAAVKFTFRDLVSGIGGDHQHQFNSADMKEERDRDQFGLSLAIIII